MKLQSKYVIALLCAMFCALHADSLPQLVEETDELEKDSSVFRKTSYYPTLTVGALTVQQPAIFNNGVTVTAGGMTASGPVLVNGTTGVGPQGPAGATGSQGVQGPAGATGANGTVLGYGYLYNTPLASNIANGEPIPFFGTGPLSNMSVNFGPYGLKVTPADGVTAYYAVEYYVQGTPGVSTSIMCIELLVNGASVAVAYGGNLNTLTVTGGGALAGTLYQTVVGRAIISVIGTGTGQVISLRNSTYLTGGGGGDTISLYASNTAGGAPAIINASLYVLQIG